MKILLGKILISRGFNLVATHGTAKELTSANIDCKRINKVREGRPHIVDMIKNEDIDLIINSTEDTQGATDAGAIRCQALVHKVPFTTTVSAAFAMLDGLKTHETITVRSLQSLH